MNHLQKANKKAVGYTYRQKVVAGHYRIPHGGTTYDIVRNANGRWVLYRKAERLGDFSLLRFAVAYAWTIIRYWRRNKRMPTRYQVWVEDVATGRTKVGNPWLNEKAAQDMVDLVLELRPGATAAGYEKIAFIRP